MSSLSSSLSSSYEKYASCSWFRLFEAVHSGSGTPDKINQLISENPHPILRWRQQVFDRSSLIADIEDVFQTFHDIGAFKSIDITDFRSFFYCIPRLTTGDKLLLNIRCAFKLLVRMAEYQLISGGNLVPECLIAEFLNSDFRASSDHILSILLMESQSAYPHLRFQTQKGLLFVHFVVGGYVRTINELCKDTLYITNLNYNAASILDAGRTFHTLACRQKMNCAMRQKSAFHYLRKMANDVLECNSTFVAVRRSFSFSVSTYIYPSIISVNCLVDIIVSYMLDISSNVIDPTFVLATQNKLAPES